MEYIFNDGGGLQCHVHLYINDIEADVEDFGRIIYADDQPDYGCASRSFDPRVGFIDMDVLKKYGITHNEYFEIVRILEYDYCFSSCAWCQ